MSITSKHQIHKKKICTRRSSKAYVDYTYSKTEEPQVMYFKQMPIVFTNCKLDHKKLLEK